MSKKLVFIVLLVAAMGMPVKADWVLPGDITATASDDIWGYVAQLAVDYTDLDFTNPAAPVSTYNGLNYWLSSYDNAPFTITYTSPASGNQVFHWLRFDFTSTIGLGDVQIWNGTSPGYSNRSLKDVDVYYTSDDGSTWNLLTSTTFTQADGTSPRVASDVVSFGGLTVDAVVIDVKSSYYWANDPFNYASVQQVLFASEKNVHVITDDGVSVAEDGETTDTYAVKLGAPPTAEVTVTATRSSDDVTLDIGSGPSASVDLVFTPGNYYTRQFVTVKAVDDGLSEGPEVVTITHAVTSGDAGYAAITPDSVQAAVTDDEEYCGEPGQIYLEADIAGPNGIGLDNRDCYVNLLDLEVMALQWLESTEDQYCGEPGQIYLEADIAGPGGCGDEFRDCYSNFYDVACSAVQWLECTDRLNGQCIQWEQPPVFGFSSIPATKASKLSDIEVRLGILNNSRVIKTYDVQFYVDANTPAGKLHASPVQVTVDNGQWGLAQYWWDPCDYPGNRNLLYEVRDTATQQLLNSNAADPWPIRIIDSVAGCRAPSTATVAYIEPGTVFFSNPYVTETEYRNLISQWHSLEMDTIVFSYVEAVMFSYGVFYPSHIPSLQPQYINFDMVDVTLDQAEQLGMKVIFGLGRGPFEVILTEQATGQDKIDRIKFQARVAAELWSMYGRGGSVNDYSDTSFYGWLNSYETVNFPVSQNFYDQVGLDLDQYGPHMPYMMSPVITSLATSQYLSSSDIDIFVYQDGLGYSFTTYANLDSEWAAYYSNHAGTGKHLWSNMECWRQNWPDPYAWVAPWDGGIALQFASEIPYASQIMMNEVTSCLKSGAPGTPTDIQYDYADDLWDDYILYFADNNDL